MPESLKSTPIARRFTPYGERHGVPGIRPLVVDLSIVVGWTALLASPATQRRGPAYQSRIRRPTRRAPRRITGVLRPLNAASRASPRRLRQRWKGRHSAGCSRAPTSSSRRLDPGRSNNSAWSPTPHARRERAKLWISITGHGRVGDVGQQVAFGDDGALPVGLSFTTTSVRASVRTRSPIPSPAWSRLLRRSRSLRDGRREPDRRRDGEGRRLLRRATLEADSFSGSAQSRHRRASRPRRSLALGRDVAPSSKGSWSMTPSVRALAHRHRFRRRSRRRARARDDPRMAGCRDHRDHHHLEFGGRRAGCVADYLGLAWRTDSLSLLALDFTLTGAAVRVRPGATTATGPIRVTRTRRLDQAALDLLEDEPHPSRRHHPRHRGFHEPRVCSSSSNRRARTRTTRRHGGMAGTSWARLSELGSRVRLQRAVRHAGRDLVLGAPTSRSSPCRSPCHTPLRERDLSRFRASGAIGALLRAIRRPTPPMRAS